IEYGITTGWGPATVKDFFVGTSSSSVFTIDCLAANPPFETKLNLCNSVTTTFEINNKNTNTNSNDSSLQGESTSQNNVIPNWIKNTAKWWSDGSID
ncbi:MAG: hypothetical protein KGH89_09290, partial [Thaumarchaeota archaeon]|nr:hypothetical protein [Nitrososphaerota archaeon]